MKRKLRNQIYRAVGNLISGIFRDDAWQPVSAVWAAIEATGASVTLLKASYRGFESKTWDVEVEKDGVVLRGQMVASFCGSVKEPMAAYDLAFII
jgi:hypothetical protein